MNPGQTTRPVASMTCPTAAAIDPGQVPDGGDPTAAQPDVGCP